jgi:hypothetical protein
MMLHGVPVAKMFCEGAPRLAAAAIAVVPCRLLAGADRVAVEAYPALVARRAAGPTPYKADAPRKQTVAHRVARRRVVDFLRADDSRAHFGFALSLADHLADELVADGTGDLLDAVCCAVQAAWAWTQRARGFGVPPACDALEGWIVDPQLAITASSPCAPRPRPARSPS